MTPGTPTSTALAEPDPNRPVSGPRSGRPVRLGAHPHACGCARVRMCTRADVHACTVLKLNSVEAGDERASHGHGARPLAHSHDRRRRASPTRSGHTWVSGSGVGSADPACRGWLVDGLSVIGLGVGLWLALSTTAGGGTPPQPLPAGLGWLLAGACLLLLLTTTLAQPSLSQDPSHTPDATGNSGSPGQGNG
jgi:hypothetical protein